MYRILRERQNEGREDGFTLIELLVVVIIIGILAAIAIPVFLNQRERAWTSAVESDTRNAAVAMEAFYSDNGNYLVGAADADDLRDFGLTVSSDVTLDFHTEEQSYCIEGSHANLDDDDNPVRVYESDAGGFTDAAECDGTSDITYTDEGAAE